jgi:hypothetical protein
LDPRLDLKKIYRLILALLNISLLICLAKGDNGTSYLNYYPTNHTLLRGEYVSGSLPSSIQNMDSDYLILKSVASDTSFPINPSLYTLGGSTNLISGNLTDITSSNDVYLAFRSYYSGINTLDFIDSASSDVDFSVDKGTHSNFTAQQYCPDSIYDTLMEADTGTGNITYETSAESYSAIGQSSHNFNYSLQKNSGNERLLVVTVSWEDAEASAYISSVTFDSTPMTHIANVTIGTGYSEYISLWYLLDSSLPSSSGSYNVAVSVSEGITREIYMAVAEYSGVKQSAPDDSDTHVNTSAGNTAITLTAAANGSVVVAGVGESGTNALTNTSNINNLQEQVLTSSGSALGHNINVNSGNITVGWNNLATREGMVGAVWQPGNKYELDLEVQWTNANFTQANAELCIYTGTTDGENIKVDVWNGSEWINLLMDLVPNSWNNVSVSSYLESPTITIRFKGSEEIADTIQDSWKIDVTLLHVWSDEQATEVEFKGSSNPQNWSNLNWTTSIGWTTDSVNVIIQLYNFSLGDYSPYGSGYLSYNSSFTAQKDDTKSQTILHNPNHFRNSTGHWKMRIKGVKLTKMQFDMKIDWLQIKPSDVHTLSTEFTFSNMISNTATLLNFSLVSRYSENIDNITLQVWNYSNSAYTTDLETCLRYTPNKQNEIKTLSITENPQFYVSNITSKIRISIESTGQFQQEIDQIILLYGYSMKSSWDQLFSWPGILLFTLPLMASLLFIPIFLFKRKKRTKNIFEDKVYPFSKSFGMSHQQMSGKKILLEVDPTSDFQEALFSFVSEAGIHEEKLLIFTSKSSPLYSKFSSVKNIDFYLLASKASSPQQRNAKETLLPASDLSVILNAIAKIHGIKRRKPVKVLFDNLSDTILLCGFETTYKFIRWLLETITSPKMTILFVFNPTAHDPKTSSSVRGLFSIQLAYGKKGPEIVTL